MIALALLPIALSVLLAVMAPRLARQVSGRVAAVLLTGAALISALSVGLVLSAVGCLAIAESPPLAAAGHWSSAAVTSRAPLPYDVVIVCAVTALGLMAAAIIRTAVSVRRLAGSVMLCRRLGEEHSGSLVVLDDDQPEAYALAGLPGRTVVTRAMLRALSGAERRALLAHEQSHVAGYHFVYVNLVQLAATANPLMRPLVASVRLAVERWADEDAAAAVTDRDVVVTALARAGLARSGSFIPAGALGAAATDLRVRLDSLATPRRSPVRGAAGVLAIVAVALGCVASSGVLGLHLHDLVEWAQTIAVRSRS